MAEHERLVSVSIDARKQQVEVVTLKTGKGRHSHYASLNQVPEQLRLDVVDLIRQSLSRSGYSLDQPPTEPTVAVTSSEDENPASSS